MSRRLRNIARDRSKVLHYAAVLWYHFRHDTVHMYSNTTEKTDRLIFQGN